MAQSGNRAQGRQGEGKRCRWPVSDDDDGLARGRVRELKEEEEQATTDDDLGAQAHPTHARAMPITPSAPKRLDGWATDVRGSARAVGESLRAGAGDEGMWVCRHRAR